MKLPSQINIDEGNDSDNNTQLTMTQCYGNKEDNNDDNSISNHGKNTEVISKKKKASDYQGKYVQKNYNYNNPTDDNCMNDGDKISDNDESVEGTMSVPLL